MLQARAPLQSIAALQDLDEALQSHLYYVVFEHLMQEPEVVMQGVFDWLNLASVKIDPQDLQASPHESDSYYRFKYLHARRRQIEPLVRHGVPVRIQQQIQQQFGWYYQTFYPGWVGAADGG